jgi:hypothetical protein
MSVLLVVCVRKVRMLVYQWLVPMHMVVRGAIRHWNGMLMLMVFVMSVFMVMANGFVDMFVLMFFRQMQPGAQRHQGAGGE